MQQADRWLGPIAVVRCAHCRNRTGLGAGLILAPGVVLCRRCFRERGGEPEATGEGVA